MSLAINSIVWEVRTAGADTNGGGFKTGASGTDYSQQNAANSGGTNGSTTDAVANGTTTITSATASFSSAIVGNVIYLQGGTGTLTAGWYEVVTFTNSTTIVVDRTIAAGTGITMNIGGALLSIGRLGYIWNTSGSNSTGQKAYIKAGTYTINMSLGFNAAGGQLQITSGSIFGLEGYNATRGDAPTGTNRPLFQTSGSPTGFALFDFFSCGGNAFAAHLRVECGASIGGFRHDGLIWNCKVTGGTSSAGIIGSFISGLACSAFDCQCDSNSIGFQDIACFNCTAKSNSAAGFNANSGYCYSDCISYSNTGAGFQTTNGNYYDGCVAYANGANGFTSTNSFRAKNCIAEGNTGNGFNQAGSGQLFGNLLLNCAGYNNSGSNFSLASGVQNIGSIAGSASFFTAPGSGDFSLNNTAGGGALLTGTGYGKFGDGLTVSTPNVGAVQAAAAAATPGHHFSAAFG